MCSQNLVRVRRQSNSEALHRDQRGSVLREGLRSGELFLGCTLQQEPDLVHLPADDTVRFLRLYQSYEGLIEYWKFFDSAGRVRWKNSGLRARLDAGRKSVVLVVGRIRLTVEFRVYQ